MSKKQWVRNAVKKLPGGFILSGDRRRVRDLTRGMAVHELRAEAAVDAGDYDTATKESRLYAEHRDDIFRIAEQHGGLEEVREHYDRDEGDPEAGSHPRR